MQTEQYVKKGRSNKIWIVIVAIILISIIGIALFTNISSGTEKKI